MPRISDETLSTIDPVWFWSQVEVGSPDECWPWTGMANGRSYGLACFFDEEAGRYRNARANRVAYVLGTGEALGPLDALHKCDNPPCCNYRRHLMAGTHRDNMADASRKGRFPRKVDDDKLAELRRRYGQGESAIQLGREFGIGRNHVVVLAEGRKQAHNVAEPAAPIWRTAGLRTPRAKLSDAQVANLRAEHAAGVSLRALALRYGISYSHTCNITCGRYRTGISAC